MASIRERSPGHFEIRAYAGSLNGTKQWIQETMREYRRRAKTIVAALGSISLAKLSPKDLDEWYAALAEEGKSGSDIHHYHRIISAALNQAERWDLIARNSARRTAAISVVRRKTPPPSREQVTQLLELAQRSKAPDLAGIILFASRTGLRRGELCALRWHDIDWDNHTALVRRSVDQDTSVITIKDTKTHQQRTVPLSEAAEHALFTRLQRQKADATAVGASAEVNGFVWSNDVLGASPFRPDRLTLAFGRTVARAERRVRWELAVSACTIFDTSVPPSSGRPESHLTWSRRSSAMPRSRRQRTSTPTCAQSSWSAQRRPWKLDSRPKGDVEAYGCGPRSTMVSCPASGPKNHQTRQAPGVPCST
jgi:integrase